MEVYELVAPGTLLKHMCKAQKAICEEFIEEEGVDTFNRVVNLVNDISNVQRPTKKIRILEDQVFIQAVYKIVLLAQGMKKDTSRASRAAEFGFNRFWKEPTPARRGFVDPPPSDNPVVRYATKFGQLRRRAGMERIANTEGTMKDAAD